MKLVFTGFSGISIAALLAAMAVACDKSSSSSGRASIVSPDKPDGMEFTGVRPISGKPGDQMNLTGDNLNESVTTILDFGSISAPVTIISSRTATFVMPDGLGLGLKEATARVGGTDAGRIALVATSATNSLPIIISDRSQVCSDVVYINAAGDQDTGTRDCSAVTQPPTPDAYNIRRGKTISGVAGKLITSCQNRVNKNIFDMAGGTNFGYARVTNIKDDRIFKLENIIGDPAMLIRDNVIIKPVGKHPLRNRSGGGNDGEFYVTQLKVTENGVVSTTYLTNNNAGEIAIRVPPEQSSMVLSGADCVNGVGLDCFDIVVTNLLDDPWDTIDDLNGHDPLGSSAVNAPAPPDSSPNEPFQSNLCGYIEGGSVPAGSILTWKDNTLDDAGAAGSCETNPGNCAIEDLMTGLTWFKGDGEVKNWYEAVYYCDQLNLNGKSWRLPTQKELMVAYANTIRNTVKANTAQDYNLPWWTSTTDSKVPRNGWAVNLASGETVSQEKTDKTTGGKALCVRSDN